MSELNQDQQPQPVETENSRRTWLRQAGTFAGIAGLAAVGTTSAFAKGHKRANAAANTMTPSSAPGAPPSGKMPMDGKLMDMAGAPDMATGVPGDNQALPQNGGVPDQSHNPNSPATTIPAAAASANAGDLAILNFALTLEFLESEFYSRVVRAQADRPFLNPIEAKVANMIALDEAAHVTALLQVIQGAKGTPVNKPTFSFPDNAFYSKFGFLNQAEAFEITGVGAYLGAAPLLKSKSVLQFAASIYGIEARHTSVIRLLMGANFSPAAEETPLTMDAVLMRVKPYIVSM